MKIIKIEEKYWILENEKTIGTDAYSYTLVNIGSKFVINLLDKKWYCGNFEGEYDEVEIIKIPKKVSEKGHEYVRHWYLNHKEPKNKIWNYLFGV